MHDRLSFCRQTCSVCVGALCMCERDLCVKVHVDRSGAERAMAPAELAPASEPTVVAQQGVQGVHCTREPVSGVPLTALVYMTA